MKPKNKIKPINHLWNSYKQHAFPALVVLLALVMTIIAVHGSSIGMLYRFFGASMAEDKNVIAFEPQPIRSDEWSVITPKTFSQANNDFAWENPEIGFGEDVAVMLDVPTKDFSVLFKPQNLAYLFLPLGNALAFKWWFLLGSVLIAAYYFCRRFFAENISASVCLALFIGFAPLLQWTYRSFIFIPLATGLIAIILLDSLLEKRKNWKSVAWRVAALAYVFTVFVLVLYPPIQIATALILGIFYTGILLRRFYKERWKWKDVITRHIPAIIALFTAVILIGTYFIAHKEAITAIATTKHPGVRNFTTGTIDTWNELSHAWVNDLTRNLHEPTINRPEYNYFVRTSSHNQSEGAGVIWLLPALVAMAAFVLWVRGRHKIWKEEGYIVACFVAGLFVLFWLFVPGLDIPIIDQVHPKRINVALLLATFLLLGALFKSSYVGVFIRNNKSKIIVLGIISAYVLITGMAFRHLRNQFPLLFRWREIILGLVAIGSILGLLAYKKPQWAMLILVVVTIPTTFDVNPIYRGVRTVQEMPIIQQMQRIDAQESGGWFMVGEYFLESLPLIAGVQTITTNFSYEQDFWKSFDPDRSEEYVYNRAVHVHGDLTEERTNIELVQANRIKINLNPCDKQTTEALSIDYLVVADENMPVMSTCVKQLESIPTNKYGRLHIFKVNK